MELPSSNIKKFLIFFYISENANTEKKNPYISGYENPKIASHICRFQTLHFSAQARKKIHPKKTSYTLILKNVLHFLSFSYISGNGNPEKIIYILRNGIFLYFRKRDLLYFKK